MAMAETARAAPPAPAQSWSLINTFQAHPALWLLLRLHAHPAGLRQQFRPDRDVRLGDDPRHDRAQPDVPRRLWRHGQPGADDRRGLRRLHGGDLRPERDDRHQPELAVVDRRAARDHHCGDLRNALRRTLGAHRGHLHDHDHARDCVRVLLFHAAELRDLQRLLGLQRGAYAAGVRRRLAFARCRSIT